MEGGGETGESLLQYVMDTNRRKVQETQHYNIFENGEAGNLA
jgi:hypothetical protein